jgi:cytoskeletal protein CcmA (bactofilin family)
MFSKADKTKAAAAANRAPPSLISSDLEVTGNIKTSGEMQLDGAVEGDVICGKLMIGDNAVVIGQIEADEVVVKGRITGQIKAGSVHLTKTARVSGDILHNTLTVEAGAFLEGHCRRNETVPASALTPQTKAEIAPTASVVVTASPTKMEAAQSRNPDAARTSPVQDGAGKTIAKTAAGN